MASKGDWQRAIDIAERLELATAERCAEARRRVDAQDAPSAQEVAAWLGRTPEEVNDLLRVGPLLPADTPTLHLPESDADPRSTPPTVPLSDAEEPTALRGTPKADRPSAAAWRRNIPRQLGPYALVEELGHGGMGIVFRARHEKLGTPCAVKVMIAGEHASPEEIERFTLEARSVARMGKHPNIVSVYDLDTQGSLTYFAMELVEGRSLARTLREREAPFTPQETARLVERVARAVHFAHEKGIIHRDLKPDNVVVRPDGEPQVMDFGLARDVSSTERRSVAGQVMGSPNYMAPEQARGEVEAIDRRTDVYGVGAILYEVLTGNPPHPGRSWPQVAVHILHGELVAPRSVRPETPRDLETVCLKALDADRGRRYATAEALAEDLARFVRGEPVHARPVGRVNRFVRRVRRHPVISGLIAGVLVLALGLGWRLGGPARVRLECNASNARMQVIGSTLWGQRWVWPPGAFRVRVVAEGYEPWERAVNVTPGSMNAVVEAKLELDHGFLTIASSPSGAEVAIDGKEIGKTPIVREAIRNGNHALSLWLADYEEWKDRVVVATGDELEKGTVALTHAQGKLDVSGAPKGMSVVVRRGRERDEVTRILPPASVTLDTGRYLLEGGAEGQFVSSVEVDVRRNERTATNLSLRRTDFWRTPIAGAAGPVALADLDGDGVLDVCVCTIDGCVHALSGKDGAKLWAFQGGAPPAFLDRRWIRWGPCIEPCDVNGDATPDILCGGLSGRVRALDGRTGHPLWQCTVDGPVLGSPVLVSADDPEGAVCVAATIDGKDKVMTGGHLCALRVKDGRLLWSKDLGAPVFGGPVACDLDGTDSSEVVVADLAGFVTAIDATSGNLHWRTQERLPGGCITTPCVGDVEGHGRPDCLVGTADGSLCLLSGHDGSLKSTMKTGGQIRGAPVMADLDGDGIPEIVTGSVDRCVYAFRRDGRPLWKVDLRLDVGAPALADVNRDGRPDVVIGTSGGDVSPVYALSGSDGRILWNYPAPGQVMGPAAVADLDGDGRLDCVVGAWTQICAAHLQLDTARWSYAPDVPIFGATCRARGADGGTEVLLASTDHRFLALRGPDGARLWELTVDREVCLGVSAGEGAVLALSTGDWRHELPSSVQKFSIGDTPHLEWKRDLRGLAQAVPSPVDLNSDGVLDCVVGTCGIPAGKGVFVSSVHALSGIDGADLWCVERRATSGDPDYGASVAEVVGAVAMGDLNRDGVPDAVVAFNDRGIQAIDGASGRALWEEDLPAGHPCGPALGDLDGDGALDCVVAAEDEGGLVALKGEDGHLLWRRQEICSDSGCPALVAIMEGAPLVFAVGAHGVLWALDGRQGATKWKYRTSGSLLRPILLSAQESVSSACVIVATREGMLRMLTATGGDLVWTFDLGQGAEVSMPPVLLDSMNDGQRDVLVCASDRAWLLSPRVAMPRGPIEQAAHLTLLRRAENWSLLSNAGTDSSSMGTSRWYRAVALAHRGVAQDHLGEWQPALRSFQEARRLALSAPDGAVYEWVASRLWTDCPDDRRKEANALLLDALAFEPDCAFDALVEARDLLPDAAKGRLRELLHEAQDKAPIAAPLLTAVFTPETASPEALAAARDEVCARMKSGEGSSARWHGYLALLAHALGEKDAFPRLYAAYLEQPRRPESLDAILSGIAARPPE